MIPPYYWVAVRTYFSVLIQVSPIYGLASPIRHVSYVIVHLLASFESMPTQVRKSNIRYAYLDISQHQSPSFIALTCVHTPNRCCGFGSSSLGAIPIACIIEYYISKIQTRWSNYSIRKSTCLQPSLTGMTACPMLYVCCSY